MRDSINHKAAGDDKTWQSAERKYCMKRWQKLVRLGLVNEARTLWRLMWHKSVPASAKVTVALAVA